jgi:hypothetical protein
MMTGKERMLAVLRGEHPDRIPWAPRLEVYYHAHLANGTLPAKYRGWDVRSIYRDQGMEYHGREAITCRTHVKGLETVRRQKGDEVRMEYITPVGSVYTLYRQSEELREQGIGMLEVEHMIKGPADYDVVEWMYQNTVVEPAYEEFLAHQHDCGDEGVSQDLSGHHRYTPVDYLMREIIGWNDCYLHLYDYPEKFERLLRVMVDAEWEVNRVRAASPALVVAHGAHFDSQMTPPPIYKTYFLPYMKEMTAYYHQHGKVVLAHLDADLTGLEEMVLESGFDIGECVTTFPLVPTTLERLREVWGNRLIIWGGLPSTILAEPYTDEEFETYMREVFRIIAPGDAFILGVADNVMGNTHWDRMERVLPLIEEYGQYPIDPARIP